MRLARSRYALVGVLVQSGLMRFSDKASAVVFGWAVVVATGSAAWTGLVVAAVIGSALLGMLLAGRLIASAGHRMVAIIGTWSNAAAAIALATLVSLIGIDPVWIALIASFGAFCDGPIAVATEARYPEIARIARRDIISVNATDDTIDLVAGLVAPVAAASLIAMFSVVAAAWALAGLSIAAAIVLTVSLPRFRERRSTRVDGLSGGLLVLRRDPILLGLTMIISGVAATLTVVEFVVLPARLLATGGGSGDLAAFLAASACGGILGATISPKLHRRASLRLTMTACLGLIAIALTILTFSTGLGALIAAGGLLGLPTGAMTPLAATHLQIRAPKALRAGTIAATGASALMLVAMMLLIVGWAVDQFGSTTSLAWLTTAVSIASIVAWALFPALETNPSTAEV